MTYGLKLTLVVQSGGDGIAAHTLNEQQDLNDTRQLFDGDTTKVDEEMVKLAAELIKRQTSPYQPSDIEDRYERRMREMIQAKLKGEGITPEAAEPAQSNVIDLMAALKRSLGSSAEAPVAAPQASKKAAPRGKSAPADKPAPPTPRSKAATPSAPAKTPATKQSRKRA